MGSVVKKVIDPAGLFFKSKTGQSEQQAAGDHLRSILKKMEDVPLPDYEKMQIALDELRLLEEYAPEQLGPTAFEEVEIDPSVIEAQRSALEEMRELGQTGLGPEDMAAFRELSRGVGAQEQARQESILQQMAQRGALDSGAQLAAQLSSSQAAANRAAAEADRIAKESAQARRQALAQSATLAGQMRGQEFGEQAKKASAKDIINQFNVQAMNQAQLRNIQERQRLAEQKISGKVGLEEKRFADAMAKVGGEAGAMQNLAGYEQSKGAAKAQAEAQKQAALLGAGASLAGAAVKSDRNLKKNIEKPSPDNIIGKLEDMLNELKAYKYEYKNEDYMPGEQMGIMAQDLEKSELGSEFVEDTPEGKMVDYGKMAPTMAAGIANLNERLSKLEEE